ncbi:lysozyme inhibitor LprI family protein [Tabrizicola fusiformis]|uniref:lysozyme inhibitor LprI family protein n=1 Tax=Tabrizicola sp. SY72 TaxID=2741673 RepID=UPI001574C96F|nr:lysozyme inhibitor LprI family protein [Tabrizicola sp. SY72]NTT85193.1 DUF1311 domain-containing protein [Tabrizicola sp. SY72]
MRAAVVLLFLALPAGAQEVDCTNAMAQQEMNFCAEQDYLEADAALNDAYKQARAAMKALDADLPAGDQGAEAALLAAQRAWLPYRDAACASEGWMMHGGSAEPLVVYGCLATLTRQRTQDLLYLVEGF